MLYMYNKYIYLNMLAVRIPKEIEDRLDSLSKKTGRTKSFYIRQALDEYLEELEDIYLAELISSLRGNSFIFIAQE